MRIQPPVISYEQISDFFRAMAVINADWFKDELAALQAENAKLEERQGIAQTVEEAEKLKVEAEQYAQTQKAAADLIMADARARAEKATANEADLVSREQDLKDNGARIDADFAARAEAAAALDAQLSLRERNATAREDAVSQREAELEANRAALAGREEKLSARLKALQSTDV